MTARAWLLAAMVIASVGCGDDAADPGAGGGSGTAGEGAGGEGGAASVGSGGGGSGGGAVELCASGPVSNLTYELARTFSIGTLNAASFATGDLDGDGDVDIVTANRGPIYFEGHDAPVGDLAVLLNDGAGDFTLHQSIPINRPIDVQIADYDGDGRLDVLVGYDIVEEGHLATYAVDAQGNLASRADVVLPGGYGPIAIATADWNGDGKPDLALLGQDAESRVTVATNDGTTFSFAEVGRGAGALGDEQIFFRDFDGDGKTDIVTVASNHMTLMTILQEDGGFGEGVVTRLPFNEPGWLPGAADFDGDGLVDVAIASWDETGFRMNLVPNVDGASFGDPVATPLSFPVWAVIAGDLDCDGAPDVVGGQVDNNAAGDVIALRNDGSGHFGAPQTLAVPGRTGVPMQHLADLNDDGVLDVIAGTYAPNIEVYLARP